MVRSSVEESVRLGLDMYPQRCAVFAAAVISSIVASCARAPAPAVAVTMSTDPSASVQPAAPRQPDRPAEPLGELFLTAGRAMLAAARHDPYPQRFDCDARSLAATRIAADDLDKLEGSEV